MGMDRPWILGQVAVHETGGGGCVRQYVSLDVQDDVSNT